jgi:Zn-dependent protease
MSHQPPPPWPSVLSREISDVFDVEERWVHNGEVRFRGAFRIEPDAAVNTLAARLEPFGYMPVQHGPRDLALVRYAYYPYPSADSKVRLHLLLLLATTYTTLLVGSGIDITVLLDPRGWSLIGRFVDPRYLLQGVPFSVGLMLILGCHELGHYITARAYGVHVSLPYFVPLPLWPMGTMGAIIRMRSPIPTRKVLFDVGLAGPLAGLAVALPVLILGLALSPVEALRGVVWQEGNSLAYLFLKWLIKGPIAEGQDVMLHPFALAGWLGLFVTALNLMPLSQLDGGHIAYATLGRGHRRIIWLFLAALGALFLISQWPGWLVWMVLAVGLGLRHPPPLDDSTPLDSKRKALAVVALVLLVLLLTPLPFAIYEF